MGLGITWQVVLAYIAGLALLYALGYLLLVPLKWVGRLLVNGLLGGVLLVIVNLLGSLIQIRVGINLVTALVAGFLGVPGVGLMLALQWLLG